MADTHIEWADKSWNPVRGCSHASEGCRHCYAEKMALRFGWSSAPWTSQNAAINVKLIESKLDEPLKWKKPAIIFVNSVSDLFHELVPFAYIDRVWSVMKQAPQHRYLILTKRPERMAEYARQRGERPLHQVWLGTSVEQQKWVGRRLQALIETGYPTTFLSAEPLLERVTLGMYINAVKWVIVGGESGPGFRPMSISWAKSIKGECQAAGVPFFFKQLGGHPDKGGGQKAVIEGQVWHGMPRDLAKIAYPAKTEPTQLGLFD